MRPQYGTCPPVPWRSRMAELKEARVPDIGDFDDVPVIEVLVAAGDRVEKDQGLVTLESDKATMEVPAPFAGVVKELKVAVGDGVGEGTVVALIEVADEGDAGETAAKADTASSEDSEDTAAATTDSGERASGSGPDSRTDDGEDRRKQAGGDSDAGAGSERPADAGPPSSPPVSFDADQVAPGKVPYASP